MNGAWARMWLGSMLVAAGGCEQVDWCVEDEAGGAPTTGVLEVTYTSPDETAFVSFPVLYVTDDTDTVVRLRGCATEGGDLWRFDGAFTGVAPGVEEQALAVSSDVNATPPVFQGWLWRCPEGDCGAPQTIIGPPTTGSGVLHVYDRSVGELSADFTTDENVFSQSEVVHMDLAWEPIAP